MEAHPTDSPVAAKSILVPPVVATLVLYGVFVLLSTIPSIFPAEPYLRHFWVALPLGLVSLAVPVLLFLSVFAINDRNAVFVPIVGVLTVALITHYVTRDAGFDQEMKEAALRHDLWWTIKYDLPPALFVSGLAIIAARWWAPRTDDVPARFEIPDVGPALILFIVSIALTFGIAVVQMGGHLISVWITMLAATAVAFATVAMCMLCATALKAWTALLPLAFVASTYFPYYLRPSFCTDGGLGATSCWDFLWPFLRSELFAVVVLFIVSVFAGAWGREQLGSGSEPGPGTEPEPEVAVAD